MDGRTGLKQQEFEVFTAAKIQVIIWVETACSTVVGYWHFRGPCLPRLHIASWCHNPEDDLNIKTGSEGVN